MNIRRALMLVVPLFCGLALTLAGCKPEVSKPARAGTGGAGGGTAAPTGGGARPAAGALEVKAYNATIKGRVAFNGEGEPTIDAKATNLPPTECPAEVMAAGWYTKSSSDKKGVQYAVVYIRPVGGRLPKVPDDIAKPAVDTVEMHQPKCQFEPRVVVMGPGQKLKFHNDSDPKISHDANLSGPMSYSKTLPPGESTVYDPEADNTQPYKVSCNQHSAFMSGFLWRFDHPFAAVTDGEGNFEIKKVPVLASGKLSIMVWHEMLPGDSQNRMQIMEVELQDGEVKDLGTVGIPKPTKTS
ncbi:MAG TPA: hypothetical protein PKD86_02190 [Gemmatales bacterium]|nr:hypothetical protein [Gemmatales bacterium]HMP58139.1 hypothetical protein [Gemmatales bacterium]